MSSVNNSFSLLGRSLIREQETLNIDICFWDSWSLCYGAGKKMSKLIRNVLLIQNTDCFFHDSLNNKFKMLRKFV